MAAYGSGPYGGGNYSYGVSLGAVGIDSTSTATAAGVRFAFGEFLVTAQTTAVVNAIRVAFMSATVASTATMVVGSNVIVNQAVTILGSSFASASAIRLGQSLVPFSCVSIFALNGVLKWQPQPDTSETWTPIPDTSETWTPV